MRPLDYRTPPPPPPPQPPRDRTGVTVFFAVLCSVFALIKSLLYHGHGQSKSEQRDTFLFVLLSLVCVAVMLFRARRSLRLSKRRDVLLLKLALCALAVVLNVLAIRFSMTAMRGQKDWWIQKDWWF